MANSKRVYSKGDLPVPLPLWWAHANPHLPRRPSHTSRYFRFSILWSHCSSPLGLGMYKILFVTSKDWSLCFLQSFGRPVIKSHWPSRPDSLGIPSPCVISSGWEAWRGVQNLHSSARTSLVLLFSSLWVTHPAGMGFDFIVFAPLLRLAVASSLSLDIGCLFFFGGFQHLPVNDCSTASCNFGTLAGGDEHISFYSTSWPRFSNRL